MPLQPGTTLGPYSVTAKIGEGGMGEVYKARDTRLDRTVAIKVLPEHVATDPDLKARFEREAKTVAALSHPHICPVFDVGTQDGVDFLVMEYLEGDTLAQRLEKGPLPLDQALRYAIEMAGALDKAHRQGIVHRDLKPGNVMLTKTGAKLLDFGLAKFVPTAPAVTNAGSAAPTMEAPLTGAGSIVGTFQYMAPEQLEGEEADARSDIFAFGATLYEMVTGQKAFAARSQASLIHAIIGVEARPVSDSQPVAPRTLDHLVARCLAKDPDDRWQTARDVHEELRWVLEQLQSVAPEAAPAGGSRSAAWRRVVPVAVASLVVGAALTAVGMGLRTETPAPARVTRLQLPRAPATSSPGNLSLGQVAISPDGRTIAFVARLPDENVNRIFVRSLDAEQATALPGTETGYNPVFSPDGTWLAYRTPTELFKVALNGGRPVALGRPESSLLSAGLSWGADDWVYYASGGPLGGGISRVRAAWGEAESFAGTEGSDVGWPGAVGDGRFVVFSEAPLGGGGGSDGNHISLLDTQTGATRVLLETGGTGATVTPTGHLLWVRGGGSLMAVPFDRDRLDVTGTPRAVVDGIQYDPASGATQYGVAGNGTLVYQGGTAPGTRLMWADTQGVVPAFPTEQVYYDPRVSPDGRRVAVEVLDDGDDVWVLDLDRGTQTKISLGAEEDETPAWSPDGAWAAWSRNQDGQRVTLRKRADGSGPEEVLWSGPEHAHVSMYAPDGRSLLFEKQVASANTDIWLLPLDGLGAERVVLGSSFNEVDARLSPDGQWLAYTSNEAGISQVYVQPFPDLDARAQVSSSGGGEPVWSRDGRRLFYRGDGAMWAVSVAPGDTFDPGVPERLFDDRFDNKAPTHTGYDVDPDGRFLVVGYASPQEELLTVVLNWHQELKRLVPIP
jgi:Tol biopolymer transport system component/predicted Ser/Thr protein kinase